MDLYKDTLGWEMLYNMESIAGSPLGYKHTDEACANMSKAQKGRKCAPFTDEHKANMSKAFKGRKCLLVQNNGELDKAQRIKERNIRPKPEQI